MPFKDYRITSAYGWRTHPIRKKKHFHSGIDLVKYHKAPIPAFVGGTVLYAGKGRSGTGLGGYGNVVLIKDSKGAGHLYAHLDSVSVKKGQKVKKGQIVGKQGATGQVTGSHLHYEIRKKTSPSYGWRTNKETSTYNPTTYLKNFNKINLTVDGKWGSATTRALQMHFGTVVDGVLSGQLKNSVTKALYGGVKYGKGGSMVIRALQRKVGAKEDGYLGTETVRKLQKHLGTVQDGKLSRPSLVVKEMQRRLNNGTF